MRETINTHYRELQRITRKAKSIVVYTNALQSRKKVAESEPGTGTAVIFTHGSVRCSKATNVSGKISITEAELQAISDAIAMCSEKAPYGRSFSDTGCCIFLCCALGQSVRFFIPNNAFATRYPLYVSLTPILLQVDQVSPYVIK